MDIVRNKKTKSKMMKLLIVGFLVLTPLSFAGYYLLYLAQAEFTLSKETIIVAEVNRGKFNVSVRGTGVLVPAHTQWVSSTIGAIVEKIAVKPGNLVKKGDLIAQLRNPQLVQQLDDAKWDLEAREAELIAKIISQESALLEQKSKVLKSKYNYDSRLLTFAALAELYQNKSAGAVSKITFEKNKLEINQLEENWLIGRELMEKMRDNLQAKSNADKARIKKSIKVLERLEQQVLDLDIKATIDGVVLKLPLISGQTIGIGSNVALIAQQSLLIAELQIPEIQIQKIRVGQSVIIDTRNNKFSGLVSRINPAVIQGNVQVDVKFSEPLPQDARIDMSVDGEIRITEIENTLYVQRPVFAQSQSRAAFYKISSDGLFAEQVKVTLGHGSIGQIQIIEGLEMGDKIIISDPTRFEAYQKIRIN